MTDLSIGEMISYAGQGVLLLMAFYFLYNIVRRFRARSKRFRQGHISD